MSIGASLATRGRICKYPTRVGKPGNALMTVGRLCPFIVRDTPPLINTGNIEILQAINADVMVLPTNDGDIMVLPTNDEDVTILCEVGDVEIKATDDGDV